MGPAAWKLQYFCSFQPYLIRPETLKGPLPTTQKYGHNVDVQLIDKPRLDALPSGTPAADYRNVPIACRILRLF